MNELQTDSVQALMPEPNTDPVYRELSGLAVAGFCAGVVSALAMANEILWLIPPVALAINLSALRAIRRRGRPMAGRRAALAGLALALIFGMSAPLQGPLHHWRLRTEAIDLARQWFVALRENRPEVAHQLATPQWIRLPADEALVARYTEDKGRRALKQYTAQPAVRLLLTSGKHAHIRYFGNLSVTSEEEQETVVDVYAVTVEQEGRRSSFFVKLSLARRLDLLRRVWSWQVSTVEFLQSAPDQLR